ncbi:hypothetical protein QC762_506450 [Podospora pseudocomata]|uniref:Microbial-type PARG catalytic domain-containing protein n=1 Tax=Podospora pseudocomata TaxID=2093779 RepID=A0ABR0GCL5_9PEZI|nr:hypothetical protein QC762_506450 [Podospora pseudocomata]
MRRSPPAPGLRPQSLPALPRPTRPAPSSRPVTYPPPQDYRPAPPVPYLNLPPAPPLAPLRPRGPRPPAPYVESKSRPRSRSPSSPPNKSDPSPSSPPPQIDPSINPILRAHLTALSPETRRVLPSILTRLGRTSHAQTCEQFDFTNTTRLDPSIRPAKNPQVTVKVVNMDTLEAALSLPERDPPPLPKDGQPVRFRPLILNFSDVDRPSGNERRGSRHGDFSQSESLCYRTSLGMSLERGRHPVGMNTSVLYNPYVEVVRRDTSGRFLDLDHPENLPVVAAITMGAQYRPETKTYMVPAGLGRTRPKQAFHRYTDRERLKMRMRLTLRVAGMHRHTRLVLGAVGCGRRYKNPAEDVALCWLEVLREDEFAVDWWTDVVFAVWDPPGAGLDSVSKFNHEIFKRVLDGKHVGEYYWRLHE